MHVACLLHRVSTWWFGLGALLMICDHEKQLESAKLPGVATCMSYVLNIYHAMQLHVIFVHRSPSLLIFNMHEYAVPLVLSSRIPVGNHIFVRSCLAPRCL